MRKSHFAASIGKSPAYISKLQRLGKLTPPAVRPDGLLDVRLATEQIAAHADPARGSRSHRPEPAHVQPQPMPAVAAPQPVAEASVDALRAPAPLTEARTRREQAQAELAELSLAKARGELVEVSSVRSLGEEVAAMVRSQLQQQLGGELAQAVLGMTDLRQVLGLLEAAQDRILAALADDADRRVARLMTREGEPA